MSKQKGTIMQWQWELTNQNYAQDRKVSKACPKQKAQKKLQKTVYTVHDAIYTKLKNVVRSLEWWRPSGWQRGLWGWRVLCTIMNHALFFVDIIFSLDWDEIPESVGQNSQVSAIPHGSNW